MNIIRKLFQYCNTWSQHPEFLNTIREVWQEQMERCEMFQIVKKLKSLKMKLKMLNKYQHKNIIKEVNDDKEALEQAQKDLQGRSGDPNLQSIENEKYQKFRRCSYIAKKKLQQRSKATWLRLGDDNTRYFYSVIKHKRLQ